MTDHTPTRTDKIFDEPVHQPPTPRTDARAGRGHTFSPGAELVFADFARTLERELAEAREAINLAVAMEGETEKQAILREAQDAMLAKQGAPK